MGDLVDASLPGSRRMALANRKQYERRPRGFPVDAEYGSPAPVWLRDVVLHAAAQLRSIARFGLARA